MYTFVYKMVLRAKGRIIMLKLFVSKAKEYEIKELAVMMVLNGLYSVKHDYLFTSVTEIAYMMTGKWIDKRNSDRRLYNNIKEGLSSLADDGYITIVEQHEDNYVISNEGLDVNTEKEKFVVIDLWEMQTIFSNTRTPFNVFMFFVNLVGTINNTTKEWHMSQDEMASQWGCSKRTVNDYLEQLSELKLLYVYKPKKRRVDGTFHKINNSYGRYADSTAVIKSAEEYIGTIECEDICEKVDRRAIKLRYNAFCNGAKKYKNNPQAIMDLLKECKLYNRSLDYMPIEGNDSNGWKKGEKLDLSVFPQIDVTPSSIIEDESIWGEFEEI